MRRIAHATWKGKGSDGQGTLTGPSQVLNETPYSFKTRFKNEEGKDGTNPEELLGASHAGCYAMALSFALEMNGTPAEELKADAIVKLEQDEGSNDFSVTHIQLNVEGTVPGLSKDEFLTFAEGAKTGCPISKALKAVPMDMEVTFHG